MRAPTHAALTHGSYGPEKPTRPRPKPGPRVPLEESRVQPEGPRLTTRFTFVPRASRLPARGVCARTRPLGLSDRAFRTRPTRQFARRIARRAAASFLPRTLGTTQSGFRDAGRVSPEAALSDPAPLEAVTMTRSLFFRSAATTVCTDSTSPSISSQSPAELHRCQR